MAEVIKVGLGSDVKLAISMQTLDGYDLEDIEWSLSVEANSKPVTIPKASAIKIDSNTYKVVVHTLETGVGALKARLTAQIPDTDLGEGMTRTEVTPPIQTNVEVV